MNVNSNQKTESHASTLVYSPEKYKWSITRQQLKDTSVNVSKKHLYNSVCLPTRTLTITDAQRLIKFWKKGKRPAESNTIVSENDSRII